MPSTTPNYSLALYNSSTDQSENFLDYRTAIAGISVASNMSIIDTALGDHDTDIAALQARKNIVAVSATLDSPNTYIATVAAITSYGTDDIIALKLDTDSNGTVTLNINTLGAKNIMKVSSAGAYVNLDGSDMRAEREYNCKYDGTRYVWMDATSADQINIEGTSGNLVKVNADNELEDSTVALANLSTIALDNLVSTAVNTDIISDTDSTDSLGSTLKKWLAVFSDVLSLGERASAPSDVAGDGQFWVKSDAPNVPMFTSDAGTDVRLGARLEISGAKMVWDAVDGYTVEVSDPFQTENGDVQEITSDIARISLSLSNSTWYHVYAYISGGVTAIEEVAVEPVSWKGSAYSKTADTSRRYIGSILTDSGGDIYMFSHNPYSGFMKWALNTSVTPFRVLSAGAATTTTAVDASGSIPATGYATQVNATNVGSGTINIVTSAGERVFIISSSALEISYTELEGVNLYYFVISTSTMYIDIAGFFFLR